LIAASFGSPSTGFANDSSGNERPLFTQPGTSPWILGTGAYFHITYDSSSLSVIRPPDSHVHVLTVDGTSLSVDSRGTLALRLFMFLLLLMYVLDPRSSFQVVRLLTLVVGSFSTVTLVLIRTITQMHDLSLALDAITPRSSRRLIGFTFPLLTPPPVSLPLLVYRLFVASSSWSLMCISSVILSSMWPSWICLWHCVFRLSGLLAWQTGSITLSS
jgi:hypothetical protein